MSQICENRKARYDYFLDDSFTCGIMLVGTEVKSIRAGGVSIAESYVSFENGNLMLINANIDPWGGAHRVMQHEARRGRVLLLHKREIAKIVDKLKRGMTIIPTKMFFNERGMVKINISLATGKKKADKRETIKQRDWSRDKARILRGDK